MALDSAEKILDLSFSERLQKGESTEMLLPHFSGIEAVTDFETKQKVLGALNAINSHIRDSGKPVTHFFPLVVGDKEYTNPHQLDADINRLSHDTAYATATKSMSPIGDSVGSVITSVVDAMKANGKWGAGHQAILDDYIASSNPPKNLQ